MTCETRLKALSLLFKSLYDSENEYEIIMLDIRFLNQQRIPNTTFIHSHIHIFTHVGWLHKGYKVK